MPRSAFWASVPRLGHLNNPRNVPRIALTTLTVKAEMVEYGNARKVFVIVGVAVPIFMVDVMPDWDGAMQ